MNVKLSVVFLFLLFVIPMSFADHGKYVHLYDISKQGDLYRISFDFDFSRDFSQEDYLVVNLFHDGIPYGEICRKQIKTNEQTVFKKVTCEFESQGPGEYIIDSKVQEDSTIKYQFNSSIYEAKDAYGHYEFEPLMDNSTLVRLRLQGNLTNAKVYSRIPKEVIPLLTESNKDSLVVSKNNYEIIEEDPLIAWNVEKIPEDVEYEVKKEITPEQQQDFSLKIEENSTFGFVKFLVGLGIITILLLIIIPAIKKKK